MFLFLDIIFYSIYVVTAFWLGLISKFLLYILNTRIAKNIYGKNHRLATDMAALSFDQVIVASERPIFAIILAIHIIIANVLLYIIPFEIDYKKEIFSSFYILMATFIPLGISSHYVMKFYTKNDRHSNTIKKFNSYTLLKKIFLFLLSSVLFCGLCALAVYTTLI